MSASNNLNFIVRLRDATSAGAQSVINRFASIQQQANQMTSGFARIGIGAAGVWGVGAAMGGLLDPAREMNRARGELMSLLDTNQSATANTVQQAAFDFAEKYGRSATDFVRASYDIQSAISGLSSINLAAFTKSSAVLAAATKADTGTITSYMGTMHSIFSDTAVKMGDGAWVAKMTGQTAAAVKMFKTDGNKISSAFASLGSQAALQGISSAEQFAVLGTLQATMSGESSGTAYASMLAALPNAERVLNLSFKSDTGKAEGIVSIIDKLHASLGDNLGLEQSKWLNKAFGVEAGKLISNLWGKTEDLKSSIGGLSKINGMGPALQMAELTTDPFDQLGQSWADLRIAFAQPLGQSLKPFIGLLSSAAKGLRGLTSEYPKLTSGIGMGVLALGGLIAGFSTLNILAGLSTFAMGGFNVAVGLGTGVMSLFSAASITAFAPVILGIAAVAAAAYGLYYYWDSVVSFFKDSWDFLKDFFGFADESAAAIDSKSESINQHIIDDKSHDSPTSIIAPSLPSRIVTSNGVQNNSNSISTSGATIHAINISSPKVDAQSLNAMMASVAP